MYSQRERITADTPLIETVMKLSLSRTLTKLCKGAYFCSWLFSSLTAFSFRGGGTALSKPALVWVPWKTEPETMTGMQGLYLGHSPRKQKWVKGKVSQGLRKLVKRYIIEAAAIPHRIHFLNSARTSENPGNTRDLPESST